MQEISPAFEIAWEAAKYNGWYYVAAIFMYGVAPVAGMMLAYFRRAFGLQKKLGCALVLVACFTCFIMTSDAGVRSIFLKWELRTAAASNDEERSIVGMRDTGNLAFAPIIAGFQGSVAAVICLVSYALGKLIWRLPAKSSGIEMTERVVEPEERADPDSRGP